MRQIIFLRGAPGSGKSSFIQNLGLEYHSIDMDTLRKSFLGAEMSAQGFMGLSQSLNQEISPLFLRLVRQRVDRGETLVIDITDPTMDFFSPIEKYLNSGLFKVAVVDFSKMPLEQVLSQNRQRPSFKQVSDATVKSIYDNLQKPITFPFEFTHFIYQSALGIQQLTQQVYQWMCITPKDLSSFDQVVHIGDLQGCNTVLDQVLHSGFDPKTAYIFVGDLVDRGIENGTLLSRLLPHLVNAPNVFLIWGNHEDHLWRYSQGKPAHSREFEFKTKPQLEAAHIDKDLLNKALLRAYPILPYHYKGRDVVVTHAGLSNLPPLDPFGNIGWHYLSMQQLTKGVGMYDSPIDQLWNTNTAANYPSFYQVHGHRNSQMIPLTTQTRSFNLEHQIEFGGQLATCTLNSAGWSVSLYNNSVFASWRERFGNPNPQSNSSSTSNPPNMNNFEKTDNPNYPSLPIPFWIKRSKEPECFFDAQALQMMRDHPHVLEKQMKSFPHVSSLNFHRDAFFKKQWDDVVVKARGLFLNTESGEIVARGYDKFFNVNETDQTTFEALSNNIQFPLTGYLKENGYLGNLGYDSKTNSLFFASKSTEQGDFATWFKEIFTQTVPPDQQEQIKRYLRDSESSMVFEVNDPIRDPHMIEYDKPHVVLLDVFHRSTDTEKLPYEQLQKLSESLGLKCKQRAFTFPSFYAFERWYHNATKDLSYRFSGKDVEGFVLEDTQGFQTKVKLPHYSFWKSMRSFSQSYAKRALEISELKNQCLSVNTKQLARIEEQILKLQLKQRLATQSDPHPLALEFKQWIQSVDPHKIQQSSIIQLRNIFLNANPDALAYLSIPWIAFDPSEREPTKIKKHPSSVPVPTNGATDNIDNTTSTNTNVQDIVVPTTSRKLKI